MGKSKAYTPEKPYMCIYETKENGIGYAAFDNEEALMELVQECKSYGDKIVESCKIESKIDITEPTKYCEWVHDIMYDVATSRCGKIMDTHRVSIEEMKYCPYCGKEIKIIIK